MGRRGACNSPGPTPFESGGGWGGGNGQIWGVHPPSPSLNAKGWPCPESLVGADRGSVLFRIKDKTVIRPGTTQKVQVYYPTASRDPSRFQYFVEGTDRWGNLPEAGLPVGCEVLDGVLPLHHHQQGYGGTQTVYLVNNTQEKQAYFQHKIIARGTVIMSAEGEMAKVYEQAVPPPQQVNGARQGQPPKKVPPGTPLLAEEEALCEELNLENRYFLRGKSQAKRRQRVKEIIARWKSVFTDETTKVGVTDYVDPFNIELEPGTKPVRQRTRPSPQYR